MVKKLWLSILAGTIILAFWLEHSFANMGRIALEHCTTENTLFLIITIFQVIWLSSQMSKTGHMKKLVSNIQRRVSQRTALAILPAVIGLLPMPGGAIFSAPMVNDLDQRQLMEPLLKTKINYWFRHVWEYWWPLYPGVLLAVEITGLPVITFMLIQLPLSLISILAGYLFLLRKVKKTPSSRVQIGKASNRELFMLLLPIIIIILSYVFFNLLFPMITQISKYLPMIIGIILAQLTLQIQKPLKWEDWRGIIISKNTLMLVLLVVLVMIYGGFIEAKLPDGTTLMFHMRQEMNQLGIPMFFVIILIPFISGMTTGIAVGFVGASMPIVMNLIGDHSNSGWVLSHIVLAYGSGYMGMILSPVHVCLIVTNEYFKTKIPDSIIRLTKPASLVILGIILLHFLFYWIL